METKQVLSVVVNAVPPYGHVIAHEKWKGSVLVQSLKGVKSTFEKELGLVDFHLSNNNCILYVSETDLVAGNGYKRKLVRFRNANSSLQGIVLVEKTLSSEQYFAAVQKFVVIELGLILLPVINQVEAAQLLTQMVLGEGKETPFCRRTVSFLLDPLVLSLVQQIPGVGKVRAVSLLQHYSSIQQLCNAGIHDLEPLVGQAAAQNIHSFFHQQN